MNLFCVYIYYPGGLESCHSVAQNNFVGATFWKFGAVCGCAYKNTKASRNCYVIGEFHAKIYRTIKK